MIDFMTGVQYVSGGDFRWWTLILLIIASIGLIIVFALLVALIKMSIEDKSKEALPEIFLLAALIAIYTPATIINYIELTKPHYEVQIGENVDMKEFLSRYDIVKENPNKTIVIKERSGAGGDAQAISE